MRYALNCIVVLLWSLWLGGLVSVFVSARAIFGADPALGRQAAPVLIKQFENYELILAGASVAAAIAWNVSSRSTSRLAVLLVFLLAAIAAAVARQAITPRMDVLIANGQTESDEFKSLHGQSMLIALTNTVALALAGLALPAAMKSRDPDAPAK